MSQVTAVTLSDGTVVNTFPNSIDGELVSRAFTELFAQIQSQATDIAENDAIIDQLRADLAARATAEQSRDSVIEECAKVCERIILEEGHSATGHGAYLCRKYIRALKSQQDAAIESKPAEQSVPVLPTHGSFNTGVLVKLLLDDALEILRPNSPEDCPEEPWMRVALGKKYWAILTATPSSIESQRSGDGS